MPPLTKFTKKKKGEIILRLFALKSEKEELEVRVAAYIHVANSKDKYILELEDNVAYLENLAVVRLYKILLKILKKIKNRITKIFR